MDMDYEKSCQTCKYRDIFHEDICHACDYKYSCWEPDIPLSPDDLIEMYEIKQRAEKDYKDALFVYANCPVGTAGRNEAYNRIWILSNVLGYSEEKVENDMQEAEDKQR